METNQITRRDYFAAAAMQSLIRIGTQIPTQQKARDGMTFDDPSAPWYFGEWDGDISGKTLIGVDSLAWDAYQVADAMIKKSDMPIDSGNAPDDLAEAKAENERLKKETQVYSKAVNSWIEAAANRTNERDAARADLAKVTQERDEIAHTAMKFDKAQADLATARQQLAAAIKQREAAIGKYREEVKIVDRIWAAYGNPTMEHLRGKSIYELIEKDRYDLHQSQARLDILTKQLAAAEKANAEYQNKIKGIMYQADVNQSAHVLVSTLFNNHRKALAALAAAEGRERAYKEAYETIRNGMGGHNHWDHTMQHGIGCEVCIMQREAREKAEALIAALSQPTPEKPAETPPSFRPPIVCLCGSTRFYDQFQKSNYDETMAGKIVLSVGFYPHSTERAHGEQVGCTPEQKENLDRLHKQKIDLADEVFVLNVNGYIGDSTKSEVRHAIERGKPIRWLEPDRAWKPSPAVPPAPIPAPAARLGQDGGGK